MKKCVRLNKVQIAELFEIINSSKSTFSEGKKAQAILMLNKKTEAEEIKMITGYSKRHIFALRKAYLVRGLDAIKDKTKKSRALLTQKERDEILNTIKNKKPSDYGYESNYWTTNILAFHIKKKL